MFFHVAAQEHVFELRQLDLAILVGVVHLHDLLDVCVRDGLAQLGERVLQVCRVDLVRVVHVERLEQSLNARLREILLYVDGGRDELRVVDLAVVVIVYLLDDVLNFLVVDNRAEVGLFEDFPEFFNLDGA